MNKPGLKSEDFGAGAVQEDRVAEVPVVAAHCDFAVGGEGVAFFESWSRGGHGMFRQGSRLDWILIRGVSLL